MARSNWEGLDSEEWSQLFGVERTDADAPLDLATSHWESLSIWQRSTYLTEARHAAAGEDPPLSAAELTQTAILFAWQDAPPDPATSHWESLSTGQRSAYLAEARRTAAGEDPPLSATELTQTAILFARQDAPSSMRGNPPNPPIRTARSPAKANKPTAGKGWLWLPALILGFGFIIILSLASGDEGSREASTPPPSAVSAQAERNPAGAALPPPLPLPPSVSVAVNAGYNTVGQAAAETALGRVVGWYRRVWELEAERPVHVQFEPTCVGPFGSEVAGYARSDPERVLICVLLNENARTALDEPEFRDTLAHEYYHAIQFNAPWFNEPWSGLDVSPECPLFLTEGAASFFGQLYASGAVDRVGLGDVLDSILDSERWWHYEEGARAFEALINRFGDAAAQFWETNERTCSDAFLRTFGMSPTRWQDDWRNW